MNRPRFNFENLGCSLSCLEGKRGVKATNLCEQVSFCESSTIQTKWQDLPSAAKKAKQCFFYIFPIFIPSFLWNFLFIPVGAPWVGHLGWWGYKCSLRLSPSCPFAPFFKQSLKKNPYSFFKLKKRYSWPMATPLVYLYLYICKKSTKNLVLLAEDQYSQYSKCDISTIWYVQWDLQKYIFSLCLLQPLQNSLRLLYKFTEWLREVWV